MDSATRSLAGSRALRMKSAFVRASVANTVCDSRLAAARSQTAIPMDPATTNSRNGPARRSQSVEVRDRGMRRMDRIYSASSHGEVKNVSLKEFHGNPIMVSGV